MNKGYHKPRLSALRTENTIPTRHNAAITPDIIAKRIFLTAFWTCLFVSTAVVLAAITVIATMIFSQNTIEDFSTFELFLLSFLNSPFTTQLVISLGLVAALSSLGEIIVN